MPLKFKCQNCGADIIVQFLKPGETALCRGCGTYIKVPSSATVTDLSPDYSQYQPYSAAKKQKVESKSIFEPKNMAELFSESARIYKINFAKMIFFAFILLLPMHLATIVINYFPVVFSPKYELMAILFLFFTLLFYIFILMPIINAAIVCATAMFYIKGKINIIECLSLPLGRAIVIIGSFTLSSVIFMVLFMTIIGIPIAIYLVISWSFIIYIATLESYNIRYTLKKSYLLIKGTWWRIFGIYLLLGFINTLITIVFNAIAIWLGFIISIFIMPFISITYILLYFDIRIRKEQYNLEILKSELSALEVLNGQ